MTLRIIIFASGNGTNAENIVQYFSPMQNIKIVGIVTNNPKAYVIERAKKMNIPVFIVTKMQLASEDLLSQFASLQVDLIVLAGFLLKIPHTLLSQYHNKIINIHPSLLPKYGGKGMYGSKVHEAVIKNGETQSGITIHLVNENYDEGKIIFQKTCAVSPHDTVAHLESKIHQLEKKYFPKVLHDFIKVNFYL